MGARLQRNLGPVSHLEPGEYTVETRDELPAVSCPACGGISEIEFGVHVGGVVSQIWSCHYASCPFVDYLTLESWGLEVVK